MAGTACAAACSPCCVFLSTSSVTAALGRRRFYPVALFVGVRHRGSMEEHSTARKRSSSCRSGGRVEATGRDNDYVPGMVSGVLSSMQRNPRLFARYIQLLCQITSYDLCPEGQPLSAVVEFQVMYHKAIHNRPRPNKLSPRLMPLIEGAGSCLVPRKRPRGPSLGWRPALLAEVMPPQAEAPLLALANRIARNREADGTALSVRQPGRSVHLPTKPSGCSSSARP